MKGFITITILFFTVAPAFSQRPAIAIAPGADSILLYNRQLQPKLDPMPNAMAVKPLPEIYVGNNGRGLDIYKSLIDGMPVAKPDGTFIDPMVLKQLSQKKMSLWHPPLRH